MERRTKTRLAELAALGTLALATATPVVAQQAVDVHTHIIIPEYVDVLKANNAELEETFPLPAWNEKKHIAFMDSAGIRTAVLTMPAPQPYYGDVNEAWLASVV